MKTFIAIALLAFVASATAAPAQSDKEKVELYANNVLALAKALVKDFPVTPEAAEAERIAKHTEWRIKEIKSQEKLTNIVDTIAYLVLDNETLAKLDRRMRHPDQLPHDDKTKVLTYAHDLIKFANSIQIQFPTTVEATEVKKIIAHVQFRIKVIESQVELTNIVDNIADLALNNEKLANLSYRLRNPDHPHDNKGKVLMYLKNVLKAAEYLEKKYPAEKKEIDAIIKSLKFRLESIEPQVYLDNVVDTIAYVVLDNEKLALIAKKHGDPIFH